LMPFRYRFTLGHKGQLHQINLYFPETAYYHLAGFHRVGVSALSNKKRALEAVFAGRVIHAHIVMAGAALEDRWAGICRLKEIIETNRVIFYYRGHEQPGSMIEGDYLITHESVAFFITGETPASIFEQKVRRYETGCPRLVTLQIDREEVTTGEIICLYRSPTYRT